LLRRGQVCASYCQNRLLLSMGDAKASQSPFSFGKPVVVKLAANNFFS
jgi:hypothetical protein